FTEQSLPSSVFFDVHSVRGIRHIRMNTDHLAYPHFINLLSTEEEETPALVGLKLLLTAWARMEDEATGQSLSAIQETREDWGRMAKRFLSEMSADG
ncbi:ATP-binding protein, partial [Alphaproteobacteria bacterium]|nr:ATP-binding protein [Alphaproteobacteria bacterium]